MTQTGYSPQAPGRLQRKALSFAPADLIKLESLSPDRSNFPLVIKPAVKGVDLPTWAELSRSWIQSQLLEQGAILFRDFAVPSVEVFQQTIAAIATEAMEYRYRASPRSQVAERIYTSTDYPADQSIFPHNEHAYSPNTVRLSPFIPALAPPAPQFWGEKSEIFGHFPPELGG